MFLQSAIERIVKLTR